MGIGFATGPHQLIYRDFALAECEKMRDLTWTGGRAIPALIQRLAAEWIAGKALPHMPHTPWTTLERCENNHWLFATSPRHNAEAGVGTTATGAGTTQGPSHVRSSRCHLTPYCFSFTRAKLNGTNCCATKSADCSSAGHGAIGDENATHVSARLVVLAVRLHPMQTQRVQERGQTLKRVDQSAHRNGDHHDP